MGGIASPEHVRAYARAGADLFGVGSALTGLDSDQMREYLAQLGGATHRGADGCAAMRAPARRTVPMDYFKTRIAARVRLRRVPVQADVREPSATLARRRPGGQVPVPVRARRGRKAVRGLLVLGEERCDPRRRRVHALIWATGAPARRSCSADLTATACRFSRPHRSSPAAARASRRCWKSRTSCERDNRQFFVLGASTREHLCDLEKFESLGPVLVATDDGSAGFHGYVPDLLREAVATLPPRRTGWPSSTAAPSPWCAGASRSNANWRAQDRIIGSIEYMTSCGVGICGKCSSPSGRADLHGRPVSALERVRPAKSLQLGRKRGKGTRTPLLAPRHMSTSGIPVPADAGQNGRGAAPRSM